MEINISNKKPLISVIINCFNGQKYLKDAIDSVINQSYKNLKFIVYTLFNEKCK